jgi:hypothetical protein
MAGKELGPAPSGATAASGVGPSVTPQEVIQLVKGIEEISEFVAKALADKPDGVYATAVRPVKLGTPLEFWLGNVDDEATLAFEGLLHVSSINEPPFRTTWQVNVSPRDAIVLRVNNQNGPWGAHLQVWDAADPKQGLLIDAYPRGDDQLWQGRFRVYIWHFPTVR